MAHKHTKKKKKEYSFWWVQDGKLKNSSGQTPKEYLKEFRKSPVKPLFPYPVSSVERNMVRACLFEAIDIAKPKDSDKLIEKYNKMREITPYTNWSGD